jgi:hypothetical protein
MTRAGRAVLLFMCALSGWLLKVPQLKILWAVVVAHPILVVNLFVRFQIPP